MIDSDWEMKFTTNAQVNTIPTDPWIYDDDRCDCNERCPCCGKKKRWARPWKITCWSGKQ